MTAFSTTRTPRQSNRLRLGTALVLLLSFFATVPESEAGLFDKIRARQAAKRAAAKKAAEPVKRTPVPRHRSWYRDEHKDAYINQELLDGEKDAERKVIIDIGRQRAYLVVKGLVAIDSAVSTARRGKYTPRGTFAITEKIKSGKVSTLYHVYMPNWMRLSNSAVGMHTGDLPGYPASAGCIRLPQSVAPIMYEHTRRGVPVEVVDSWDESELVLPYTMPQPYLMASAY
ncbi:MAG: L,D-transpeptidase [Verrucomicrobiales bacterium]|nr:L,D-transpeptidase [Verrucomicrobiales bacterium]